MSSQHEINNFDQIAGEYARLKEVHSKTMEWLHRIQMTANDTLDALAEADNVKAKSNITAILYDVSFARGYGK